MGTPQAAVPSLSKLIEAGHDVVAVYTQPDRPSGRGNKIAFSPVKQLAIESGLPVFQPMKIRAAETLETFRSHEAVLAVVVAYGRILPDEYLSAYQHGAINVHFSLLPKYRGAAPVNWAIVNGESETGVTTMKMDSGLDTGDILLQSSTPIGPEENAIELMSRLSFVGADLLDETLRTLDAIVPRPQDNGLATFAPIMRKENGRVDWSMSAKEISDRVRGFQPFPTTFTTFRGHRLTIWKAVPLENEEFEGVAKPGCIAATNGGELIVGCGHGTFLRVLEIQLEGKKRMGARDFVNGMRPVVEEQLGDDRG